MKIAKIVIIILLMASGQTYTAPLDNVTSSALMPGDSAKFNMDFIDPFGLPIYDITLHARAGNSDNEYSTPMTHVDPDPRYLNTYEGSIQFNNPSGQIQYYGRVAGDTLVITQSYKNANDQFPPPPLLYVELAGDALNDTTPGTPGQWLDLTGAAITYSDTKIYGRLSNAGGGWPNNQGFTTYFLYGFFLANPDSVMMSGTAMIYGNIPFPFSFSPGLYSVNLADTSFSRIADISSNISDDYFQMACEIADLQSDPAWPVWPPEMGFIMAGGFTLTITLDTPSFNDYTYPSGFIPQTGFLNADSNNPPALDNIGFDIIPGLEITARCQYFDSDGNLPALRQLFFDRGVFDMGSLDHIYSDTAQFIHLMTWPGEGVHYYFFRFSDGADTIETAMDTLILTPNGVPDEPLPVTVSLEQNYPNPFNAQTVISFAVEQRAQIRLDIYDIAGRRVRSLFDGPVDAGERQIIWDGRDDTQSPVSSGIYFSVLKTLENSAISQKMLLIK